MLSMDWQLPCPADFLGSSVLLCPVIPLSGPLFLGLRSWFGCPRASPIPHQEFVDNVRKLSAPFWPHYRAAVV